MKFSELVIKRRAVRAYQDRQIEEEKLAYVLEAARMAPTANNQQPFQLIVIHTEGRDEELSRMYHREWFRDAPIVICACAVPEEGWVRRQDKVNYRQVDVAIAVTHLTLAAAEIGLGTCWIGAFDPEATIEVLGLPEGVEPVVFVTLGYPDDEPRVKERKPLEALVRYGGW